MSQQRSGHRPRKRFGQNFLHDKSVIERIARAVSPRPGQHVVEIGPGKGALTRALLEAGARVTAIEIDRDLAALLREELRGELAAGRFSLIELDVLDFDFSTLTSTPDGNGGLTVVGNLPYNISTPLLFHLLRYQHLIKDMHFMLQREVVDRLAAKPGGGDYGRLSVMVQYHCQVQMLFTVPPGAFSPRPKVESAIVRLTPCRPPLFDAVDMQLFAAVVREAFSQRRKTIRNTLRARLTAEQLDELGLDPGKRPEQISVADYVRITHFLSRQGRSP